MGELKVPASTERSELSWGSSTPLELSREVNGDSRLGFGSLADCKAAGPPGCVRLRKLQVLVDIFSSNVDFVLFYPSSSICYTT